jgi:hypothetical protein
MSPRECSPKAVLTMKFVECFWRLHDNDESCAIKAAKRAREKKSQASRQGQSPANLYLPGQRR